MVPTTHQQRKGRADDIGKDVEGIKVSPIGKEALDNFRTDAEASSAYQEGDVHDSPT